MKFLCLHGSYGSAANFQVQLQPFIEEVEASTPGRFRWIDGFHQVATPDGFHEYFGAPPLYKFLEHDSVESLNVFVEKLRDFPVGLAPEDCVRLFLEDVASNSAANFLATVNRLLEIVDSDPEIEGILGYSEGAMIAGTLILEERRRYEEMGRPRRLKCGIFFAGWPPVRLVEDSIEYLLADECEDVIDVPTCHIVGCKDPYIPGSMALYNMCDPDSAHLFDHGKGHTVPRDQVTIKELAGAIGKCIAQQISMTSKPLQAKM